jgi:hypothetical protein
MLFGLIEQNKLAKIQLVRCGREFATSSIDLAGGAERKHCLLNYRSEFFSWNRQFHLGDKPR